MEDGDEDPDILEATSSIWVVKEVGQGETIEDIQDKFLVSSNGESIQDLNEMQYPQEVPSTHILQPSFRI